MGWSDGKHGGLASPLSFRLALSKYVNSQHTLWACPVLPPHASHPLHSLPSSLTQESGALQPEAPTTTAPLNPFSPPCLVSLPAGVQAPAIPAGSSSALVSSCCQPNIKKQAAWSHSFLLNSWYSFGISKSDPPTPRQNRKQTYFIGWNSQEGALFVWILMLRSWPYREEERSQLQGDGGSPPWVGLWTLPVSGPLGWNLAETSSSPREVLLLLSQVLSLLLPEHRTAPMLTRWEPWQGGGNLLPLM